MAGAMVWAVSVDDNSARHIAEVKSGLDCRCVCPGCLAVLEAVNSENPAWKRRPHFRHHKSPELENCTEAGIVAAIKAVFSDLDVITLPSIKATAEARAPDGTVFRETLREEAQPSEISSYEFLDTTDAVLTLSDGEKVYVRLIASGSINAKLSPKQTQFAEVVIDISDAVLSTADRATLRQYISLSQADRMWCHHQRMQSLLESAQKRVDKKAEEYVVSRTQVDGQRSQYRTGQASNNIRVPPAVVERREENFVWTKGFIARDAKRRRGVMLVRNYHENPSVSGRKIPPIPFDKILSDAASARNVGDDLASLLSKWDEEYKLCGFIKPITDVLLVSGLVRRG